MPLILLLCLIGGCLLAIFPKTGIAVIIVTSVWVGSKSIPHPKKSHVIEESEKSMYVAQQDPEQESSPWLTRIS